ncbi:uncharacterized protein LOC128202913 [Mya arenaria]|uniref:uncharacterized protein LOC128202913 n=1 Tax=Mya arenaria TaxID=6604 RepID=UPI0022DFFD58|nr:uncharacterized protein LOC128202913 [Mya arenaria]
MGATGVPRGKWSTQGEVEYPGGSGVRGSLNTRGNWSTQGSWRTRGNGVPGETGVHRCLLFSGAQPLQAAPCTKIINGDSDDPIISVKLGDQVATTDTERGIGPDITKLQIKATANLSLLETEHKQNICQEAMCSQAVNNETFVGVLYDKDVDLNQKHPPKKQDKADKKQLHSASNHEVHIPHENIQNLRETKTPNTSVCDTNEQIGNEGEFNEILRAVSLQNTNDNSVDKSKDQGKKVAEDIDTWNAVAQGIHKNAVVKGKKVAEDIDKGNAVAQGIHKGNAVVKGKKVAEDIDTGNSVAQGIDKGNAVVKGKQGLFSAILIDGIQSCHKDSFFPNPNLEFQNFRRKKKKKK